MPGASSAALEASELFKKCRRLVREAIAGTYLMY